jgi:hypothetical protein
MRFQISPAREIVMLVEERGHNTNTVLVSRARRSAVSRCAADPGPSFPGIKRDPGSAMHHCVLHRVRGTKSSA